MPKKNKVAKKRLDKFYHLAKERGYRSRAAFKLLQLDKKYDFLSRARGCLDLCAAPGSWMQVARQHMPADAPVVGVDLAAIKPVAKCVALQEDITTQKCRAAIKRELKEAKVDVVLHDGAPNVGTAWLNDAYGQNELTLHAMRLAVDFLQPGGWFVTKVFRSNDYNSLLFVFGQLFHRVEATKPTASRNESAEIFVVCKGFKNATIDPKFLDPKHVFKELEDDSAAVNVNVLQQKKNQKAKAVGYDTSSQVLHARLPVASFVLGGAPVKALGEYNAFLWDDSPQCELWRQQRETKPEILQSCADLKVLGKREFRQLLTWRLKMAEVWKKATKQNDEGDEVEEEAAAEGSEDEAERQAAEMSELEVLQSRRLKGAKRKAAEKRAKLKERLTLKMEHPGDRLDIQEEMELFSISKLRTASALAAIRDETDPDVVLEEEEEEVAPGGERPVASKRIVVDDMSSDDETGKDYVAKLDDELEDMYADYLARTQRRAVHALKEEEEGGPTSKKKKREARLAAISKDSETPDDIARRVAARELKNATEREAYDEHAEVDDDSSDDGELAAARNPLLVHERQLSGVDRGETKADRWFSNPLFEGLDEEDDEEEVAALAEASRAKRQRKGFKEKAKEKAAAKATAKASAATLVEASEAEASEVPASASGEKAGKPSGRRGKPVEPAGEEESGGGGSAGGKRKTAAEKAAGQPGVAAPAKQSKKARVVNGVPDDAKFVDIAPEEGEKVVGGRFAQYDSADEGDEDLSAQTSISRQAEAMVLGQMLLNPQKRRELEDAAYNRHISNDQHLPQWFLDDERKFATRDGYGVELDDNLMGKAKDKLKSITAQSISKVAEAKGRKQRRQQRALLKLKKKANAVINKDGLSEREKAREVEKLYKSKLAKKEKKEKKLVVGRKFQAGSSGKKGHGVKFVDARSRTDKRGEKRAEKLRKKSGKSKGASPGAKKSIVKKKKSRAHTSRR